MKTKPDRRGSLDTVAIDIFKNHHIRFKYYFLLVSIPRILYTGISKMIYDYM